MNRPGRRSRGNFYFGKAVKKTGPGKQLIVLLLAVGLLAFGLTSAYEVFHPASHSLERHSHPSSGSETSYGSVSDPGNHYCIHSSTYLDVQELRESVPDHHLEDLRLSPSTRPALSTFDFCSLRAPPKPSRIFL